MFWVCIFLRFDLNRMISIATDSKWHLFKKRTLFHHCCQCHYIVSSQTSSDIRAKCSCLIATEKCVIEQYHYKIIKTARCNIKLQQNKYKRNSFLAVAMHRVHDMIWSEAKGRNNKEKWFWIQNWNHFRIRPIAHLKHFPFWIETST